MSSRLLTTPYPIFPAGRHERDLPLTAYVGRDDDRGRMSMSTFHVHRSSPAKSGPPNEPPKPGPPTPTPRSAAHVLGRSALRSRCCSCSLPRSTTKTTSLSFTEWKTKVDANQVKTATIEESARSPDSSSDKDQTHYQSCIPTALNDNTLAADLEQHDVDVKGKASSTSFGAVLASLLPLILLVGFFFWISRRASRQLAGGIMGIGASRGEGLRRGTPDDALRRCRGLRRRQA